MSIIISPPELCHYSKCDLVSRLIEWQSNPIRPGGEDLKILHPIVTRKNSNGQIEEVVSGDIQLRISRFTNIYESWTRIDLRDKSTSTLPAIYLKRGLWLAMGLISGSIDPDSPKGCSDRKHQKAIAQERYEAHLLEGLRHKERLQKQREKARQKAREKLEAKRKYAREHPEEIEALKKAEAEAEARKQKQEEEEFMRSEKAEGGTDVWNRRIAAMDFAQAERKKQEKELDEAYAYIDKKEKEERATQEADEDCAYEGANGGSSSAPTRGSY